MMIVFNNRSSFVLMTFVLTIFVVSHFRYMFTNFFSCNSVVFSRLNATAVLSSTCFGKIELVFEKKRKFKRQPLRLLQAVLVEILSSTYLKMAGQTNVAKIKRKIYYSWRRRAISTGIFVHDILIEQQISIFNHYSFQ